MKANGKGEGQGEVWRRMVKVKATAKVKVKAVLEKEKMKAKVRVIVIVCCAGASSCDIVIACYAGASSCDLWLRTFFVQLLRVSTFHCPHRPKVKVDVDSTSVSSAPSCVSSASPISVLISVSS